MARRRYPLPDEDAGIDFKSELHPELDDPYRPILKARMVQDDLRRAVAQAGGTMSEDPALAPLTPPPSAQTRSQRARNRDTEVAPGPTQDDPYAPRFEDTEARRRADTAEQYQQQLATSAEESRKTQLRSLVHSQPLSEIDPATGQERPKLDEQGRVAFGPPPITPNPAIEKTVEDDAYRARAVTIPKPANGLLESPKQIAAATKMQSEESKRAAGVLRGLKAQGVEMVTDLQGNVSPKKDDQGRLVYEPKVLTPFEDRGNGNYVSVHRDRQGNEQDVPLVPKIDKQTGEKYVVSADGVTRMSLGIDQDFVLRKDASESGQVASQARAELGAITQQQTELKKLIEDYGGKAAMIAANKNATDTDRASLKQIQIDRANAVKQMEQLKEMRAAKAEEASTATGTYLDKRKQIIGRLQQKDQVATQTQNFDTKLTPDEESAYQYWRKAQQTPQVQTTTDASGAKVPVTDAQGNAVTAPPKINPNDNGADYDYRGAFKAGVQPDASGHWPDTFKKPNHPTFSEDSKYAAQHPELAGKWEGDKFIPPGGAMMPNEAAAKALTGDPAAEKLLNSDPSYAAFKGELLGRVRSKEITPEEAGKLNEYHLREIAKQPPSARLLPPKQQAAISASDPSAAAAAIKEEIHAAQPRGSSDVLDYAVGAVRLPFVGEASNHEIAQKIKGFFYPLFGPNEEQQQHLYNSILKDGPSQYGLIPSLSSYVANVSSMPNLIRGIALKSEGKDVTLDSLEEYKKRERQAVGLEKNKSDSKPWAVTKGVANSLLNAAETIENPAFLSLPSSRAISGFFSAQMFSALPDAIGRIKSEPTLQGKVEAATDAAVDVLAGGYAARHAMDTSAVANASRKTWTGSAETADLVQEAIKTAKSKGVSPEFRSFFGGIDPEVAGTTPEKVSEFAKSLGMEWKPTPKVTPDAAKPEVPLTDDDINATIDTLRGDAKTHIADLQGERQMVQAEIDDPATPATDKAKHIERLGEIDREISAVQALHPQQTKQPGVTNAGSQKQSAQRPDESSVPTAESGGQQGNRPVPDKSPAELQNQQGQKEGAKTIPREGDVAEAGADARGPQPGYEELLNSESKGERVLGRVAKAARVEYGGTEGDLHHFSDPESGTSFTVPRGTTPHEFAEKLLAVRERMGDTPANTSKVTEFLRDKDPMKSAKEGGVSDSAALSMAQQLSGKKFVGGVSDARQILAEHKKSNALDKSATVDAAAHEAATSPQNGKPIPSLAQHEGDNAELGHSSIGGMPISFENPAGSIRTNADMAAVKEIADGPKQPARNAAIKALNDHSVGNAEMLRRSLQELHGRGVDVTKGHKPWANKMLAHYGRFKGTVGKDGDHLDAYVKEGTPKDWKGTVYVVNQKKADGSFDEHKAMVGYANQAEAVAEYAKHYDIPAAKLIDSVAAMPWEQFKTWAREGDLTKKAVSNGDQKQEAATVPVQKPSEAGEGKSEVRRDVPEVAGERGRPVSDKAETAPVKGRANRLLTEAMLKGKAKATLKALDVEIVKGERSMEMQAHQQAGTNIVHYRLALNPDRIDERTAHMSDDDAREYVTKGISEELIHGAQYEAARLTWDGKGKFDDHFQKEYEAVEQAMTDEERDAVWAAYGSDIQGGRLGAEFVRQLIQTGREGAPTEATIRAKSIIERILAVLKKLLDNAASWSEALKRAYDRTSAVLDSIESESGVAEPKAKRGTPEWSAELQSSFKKFKTRLTRAQNAKDWPAIAKVAKDFNDYYEAAGTFPDDWARFVRAGEDAERAIARDEGPTKVKREPAEPKPQQTPAVPARGEVAKAPVAETRPAASGASDELKAQGKRAFEGLFAPEPNPSEAQQPLPRDKRGAMMQLADSLQAENITTPEKVAAYLDEISDGKARPYSQALWDLMTAVGVVTRGEHDWANIYSTLAQTANGAQVAASDERDTRSSNRHAGITAGTEADRAGENEPSGQVSGGAVPAAELAGERSDTGPAAGQPRSSGPGAGSGSVTEPGRGDVEPTDSGNAERDNLAVEGSGPDAGRGGVEAARSPDERNHVIGPGDTVAPRGAVAKLKANLSAVKLLKKLEADKRNATPEEKQKLVQYTGWGQFKGAFDTIRADRRGTGYEDRAWTERWGSTYDQLKKLLTPDEWNTAAESTLNAHFTAPEEIRSMWNIAERLGFKGGRVLEPAVGVGHFLGLMPPEIAAKSQLFGLDMDKLSSGIARKLYPQADIKTGKLEKAKLPNNYFDLVISNVPFHEVGPGDSRYPKQLNLHNYFLARSFDLVKPSGLVVAISSNSTLDNNPEQRAYLQSQADLVAAIRLPNNAFLENAGTEVTTDILIFRKPDGTPFKGESFLNTVQLGSDGEKPIVANEYFQRHPEMALGTHSLKGTQYQADSYALTADKYRPIEKALPEAIATLPENLLNHSADFYQTQDFGIAKEGDKEGSISLREGLPIQLAGSTYKTPAWALPSFRSRMRDPQARIEAAKSFVGIRDKLKELLAAELQEGFDESGPLRGELKKLYDAHVRRFGNLEKGNLKFLEDDPEYYLVMGLEIVGKERRGDTFEKVITPADVLTKRVLYPMTPPTSAADVKDGAMVSLQYRGKIDPEYVAQLTGMDTEEAQRQLLDTGTVFKNPKTGLLETRDAYLSSNVRQKLREAEAAVNGGTRRQITANVSGNRTWAGYDLDDFNTSKNQYDNVKQFATEAEAIAWRDEQRGDQTYAKNVEELKAIQPERVSFENVRARAGSSWIPEKVYTSFAQKVLGRSAKVTYTKAIDRWSLELGYQDARLPENLTTYGTDRASGVDILTDILNLKNPTITDQVEDVNAAGKTVKRTVVNQPETDKARDKARRLRSEFDDYSRSDPDARQAIEDTYNDTFNSYVVPRFDGSHLVFPGMAASYKGKLISLRPHQKDVVYRITQAGGTLMAHGVGGGKTIAQIAAAMEMRRLGQARKPLLVVDKPTIGQFAATFRQIYPNANILVATEDSFSAANRKRFMSRIATGNWDSVIMSNSQFDLMPSDPEVVQSYVQTSIDQLREIAGDMAESDGKQSPKVRQIQTEIKRLEKRLESVLGRLGSRQDDTIYFEQSGVDALFVDEAHAYKKVPFVTKMDPVKGIDRNPSQRSINLHPKIQFVQKNNRGRNVILATGTPVTNTLSEAWNMTRLVAPQLLEEWNVDTFDKFVSTFAETVESTEINAANQWVSVERLSRFTNGPELVKLIRTAWDVRMGEDLKGLDLPDIKGGKPELVALEITPQQIEITNFLQNVYKQFQSLTGKERREYSWIPVVTMSTGMAAATDPRLVDSRLQDNPNSVVNHAVSRIAEIYHANTAAKATQIVFLDRFRPMNTAKLKAFANGALDLTIDGTQLEDVDAKFNLYDDIRDKLVAAGISRDEIAIANEHDTDAKRLKMQEDMQTGRVRVLIGSTAKIGQGINVQDKLIAAHHLDPPIQMTPAQYIQRNGRIIRDGNEHNEVEIITYGMKRTLAAGIWQRIETKAKFIVQVLMGKGVGRDFEDPADEVTMSIAEQVAELTGDNRILRKVELESEVRKLQQAKEAHFNNVGSAKSKLRSEQAHLENLQSQALPDAKADKTYLEQNFGEDKPLVLKIGGDAMPTVEAFEERWKAVVKAAEDKAPTYFAEHKAYSSVRYQARAEINGLRLESDITVYNPEKWSGETEIATHFGTDKTPSIDYSKAKTARGLIVVAKDIFAERDKRIADVESAIQTAKDNIGKLNVESGKTFTQGEELQEKETELNELVRSLSAAPASIEKGEGGEITATDEGIAPTGDLALAAPEPGSPDEAKRSALISAYNELPPTEKKVVGLKVQGASDAEISKQLKLSPVGVETAYQIALKKLNKARTTGETVRAKFREVAAEKPGERTMGRPELANPAQGPMSRRLVDTVDELRKEAGIPGVVKDTDVAKEAKQRLEKDYTGERRTLMKRAAQGGMFNDVETLMAKRIVAREALGAVKSNSKKKMLDAAKLIDSYRMTGSEQARAFRQRQDFTMLPEERAAEYLSQALLTPDKPRRRRLQDIEEPERREAVLAEWMTKVEGIKKRLAKFGIDLDAMTEDQIFAALKDRSKAVRAIRAVAAAKADKWDALYEGWIAGLLSAPPTQIANAGGNITNAIWDFTAQRFAEAVVNLAVRDPESAQFAEFQYIARGIMPGLHRAAKNFLMAWRTETPVFEEEVTGEEGHTKIEGIGHTPAIEGTIGRAIRTPLRLLLAVDEFTKSLTGTMQVQAEALRIAMSEKLTGNPMASRIAELVDTLGSEAWQAAASKSKELAFQKELGSIGKLVTNLRDTATGPFGRSIRYFVPFIQTMSNIFKTGIRKTPLGSISLVYNLGRQGMVRMGYENSGWEYKKKDFVPHMAEQLLAWAIYFAIQGLTEPDRENDDLPWWTGTVPYQGTKRGERDLAYRTAPPMSIRIGSKWYSYARIEPFATALATMIDAQNEIRKAKNGKDFTAAIGSMFTHLIAQVKDKTFARGIGDILNAIEDGQHFTEWAANFATSWVPNLIKVAARESDPYIREQKAWGRGEDWTSNFLDALKYKALPLSSEVIQPKIDLWGRPVEKDKGISPATDWLFRMISPARTQPTTKVLEVDRLITNWNNANPNETFAPQPPAPYWTKKIDGKERTFYMTREEYRNYLKMSGAEALGRIEVQGMNPDKPTREDLDAISDALKKSHKDVKERLWEQRLTRKAAA